MTKRTILHAADIHLDSPLQKLDAYEGAPVDLIRGASRRALTSLTDLAIDRQVDLVVIAGDLYDGDWNSMDTGLFFVKEATRLVEAGIPLFFIRGNHDAANKMTSSLPLPRNLDGNEMLLSEKKVDLRVLDDLQIAVHGRSYRNRAESSDLSAAYPTPLPGVFNLGLLHTSLTGAEGHEPYAPCTPRQLTDKQYDYWALGHVHVRGEHQEEGAAPIVFSGNLQGRHARETGPKGCVLVEIDDQNQTQRTFETLDAVRWEVCEITMDDLQHQEDVLDEFARWITTTLEALNEDGSDRLLVARVRLIGQTDLHERLLRERFALESDLRSITLQHGGGQVWLEDLRVRTRANSDGEHESGMDGPLECLKQVVAQLRSSEDFPELASDWFSPLSKKLPPELLRGASKSLNTDDEAWTRTLLESAAADVANRLQRGGKR